MKYKEFIYQKMENEDAIEIKGYEGIEADVIVPSSIDGYPVRKIGYRAFAGKDSIKSIRFPRTIQRICSCAFYQCTSLEEVQLPYSCITVDEMAFSSCKSLKKFKISRYVEHIDSLSFLTCYRLEAIDVDVFNEYYCSIDGVLFSYDLKTLIKYPAYKHDTSYVVPNSVTTIDSFAFCHATHLQKILLPRKLEVIGSAAFERSGLKKVTIPDSVCEIHSGCFNFCEHLEKIDLSEQLTEINQHILAQCPKLQSVTIPLSVKTINCLAFVGNNEDFYVKLNKQSDCIELLNVEEFTKFVY